MLAVTLGATGSALADPQRPQRIVVVVACSVAAVVFVVVMSRGRVALCVDDRGVVLGGNPLVRYEATTERIAWKDIAAIVLIRQQLLCTSRRYIAIQHLAGHPGERPARLAGTTPKAVLGGLMAGKVFTCRPVSGWRLELYEFEEAVAHHAPHVAVHVPQTHWRSRSSRA